MIDDYALLGVPPHVSEDELRAAFLFLAKKFHPDANLGNEKQAAEHFKNVEAAYFRIRLRLSQAQTSERKDPPKEAKSPPPATPAPSSPPRPKEGKSSSRGALIATFLLLGGLGVTWVVTAMHEASSHVDSATAPPAWQRGPQPPLAAPPQRVAVVGPDGIGNVAPEDLQTVLADKSYRLATPDEVAAAKFRAEHAAPDQPVAVFAPKEQGGQLTTVPASRLDEALSSGYGRASQADIDAAKFQAEHGKRALRTPWP